MSEVTDIHTQFDMLVVPSIWYENSPFAIQEAFLARVPVITSNIGGMAELVTHNVNGLLFIAGDAHDLNRTITSVIEDPQILGRLRDNMPRLKTIDEHATELASVYRDLLRGRDGGAQR